MKATRQKPNALRSSVILGGLVVVFLCFPASAYADDWGFSFRIPFLGFYVGPYYPTSYDDCCCPVYDSSQQFHPWLEQPVPSPIPGIEDDQYRKEVNPSNPTAGPQTSVEELPASQATPERIESGKSPDTTADRRGELNPPVEVEDPANQGSDLTVKGEAERPSTRASDDTSAQKEQSERTRPLIPLQGVN